MAAGEVRIQDGEGNLIGVQSSEEPVGQGHGLSRRSVLTMLGMGAAFIAGVQMPDEEARTRAHDLESALALCEGELEKRPGIIESGNFQAGPVTLTLEGWNLNVKEVDHEKLSTPGSFVAYTLLNPRESVDQAQTWSMSAEEIRANRARSLVRPDEPHQNGAMNLIPDVTSRPQALLFRHAQANTATKGLELNEIEHGIIFLAPKVFREPPKESVDRGLVYSEVELPTEQMSRLADQMALFSSFVNAAPVFINHIKTGRIDTGVKPLEPAHKEGGYILPPAEAFTDPGYKDEGLMKAFHAQARLLFSRAVMGAHPLAAMKMLEAYTYAVEELGFTIPPDYSVDTAPNLSESAPFAIFDPSNYVETEDGERLRGIVGNISSSYEDLFAAALTTTHFYGNGKELRERYKAIDDDVNKMAVQKIAKAVYGVLQSLTFNNDTRALNEMLEEPLITPV